MVRDRAQSDNELPISRKNQDLDARMANNPTKNLTNVRIHRSDSPIRQCNPVSRLVITGLLVFGCLTFTGCQDGPLYALKATNPYYAFGEWKRDEEIGVTDHERRKQLALLADTIDTLPANKQQFWSGHLSEMIENDESPEMRRLAIRAAGKLNSPAAMTMIEKGLDDESVKVRMESCAVLGRRRGEEASRALASVAGTETSEDVQHAALQALAKHKGQISVDALKLALSNRNPATRDLAVQSLKGVTGKNYGDDPQVWIAALEGKPTRQQETRIADRVRQLF